MDLMLIKLTVHQNFPLIISSSIANIDGLGCIMLPVNIFSIKFLDEVHPSIFLPQSKN